jgi:uncharacterized protein (DUF4415 family)
MKSKTDWKRLDALTDADISRAVAADPDTRLVDTEWFKRAQLVMPQPKEMVSLRLDQEVLDWFRKTGRGYQTRINAVLRAFVEAQGGRSR